MNQPELSFGPASRATDPSTSKAAEQRVTQSGARRTQAEHVLALVKRHPGKTSAELADISESLDRWQVARRLPDLEQNGLAHKGKRRACQIQNSNAVTWWPGPDPDADHDSAGTPYPKGIAA